MHVHRIAAFTRDDEGGNPAGVAICEQFPVDPEMLRVAKEVGYSETAFLVRQERDWRVRYFAPEIEVPFCGHATIASGAVLGERYGVGTYELRLNSGHASVSISDDRDGRQLIALQSPETQSEDAPRRFVQAILERFGLSAGDLDARFPLRISFAGARHLIVVLNERQALAEMSYDLEATKPIMLQHEVATIALLWPESEARFHARNAFAAGGVYEDPATGAAAAAFAGYLRDIGLGDASGRFEILQGEDMGCPCRLLVEYTPVAHTSVKVAGYTRRIA